MSESAKWYVIHTYSGYENKVAQTIMKVVENRKLHDLIEEVQVPTEMVMEMNEKNQMREVERKIFPGYVLVKMILTDDSWYVVRNTRGCTGFVGPGSKPVPLTDKEAAALGVDADKKPASVEVNYKAGDKVKVGDVVAATAYEDLGTTMHASINGTVKAVTDRFVIIER